MVKANIAHPSLPPMPHQWGKIEMLTVSEKLNAWVGIAPNQTILLVNLLFSRPCSFQ